MGHITEPHIFVVENHDSFTYNLVQYLWELGAKTTVLTSDSFLAEEIAWNQYQGVMIGPGPGRPNAAGQTMKLLEIAPERTKIIGVCLGHQAIGQHFGARLGYAEELMHGRTSRITHNAKGLFANIPPDFNATRYHSLALDKHSLRAPLEITALSEKEEVMAITHQNRPIDGIQFHPESFMTEHGHQVLRNWLSADQH